MEEKIIITREDLMDTKVDEVLKRQAEELSLHTGMQTNSNTGSDKIKLIHKSWFNLMVVGLIGAFIAWLLVEPIFDDDSVSLQKIIAAYLLFSSVGGFCGLLIGCVEGILSRNFTRAIKGGLLGGLIGFVGGLISTYAAGIVFSIVEKLAIAIFGIEAFADLKHNLLALAFIMVARSLAWCIAGMALGLGPGIALKSKKLTLNGFLGGLIGGALGGLLFDPINYIVSAGSMDYGAEISRGAGLVIIGLTAGLMIGLVELITMDAWLYMTDGPLRGKQFIIYKNPTFIGSSTKAEIYLFKDPYINPWHAKVSIVRDGYLLEDNESISGTFVNGRRIKKHKLVPGDVIKIGESTLIYREKNKTMGGH
ncbi:MAG: FHA domain-containing protein [Bacillota bacterium]|nr:FHA domain-containing protein [Bacillota bacterium]